MKVVHLCIIFYCLFELDKNRDVGKVVAIDLLPIHHIDGALLLAKCDVTQPDTENKIRTLLTDEQVDVFMSDMAPSATGVQQMDHHLIVKLCYHGLSLAYRLLKPNGTFLCKYFQGDEHQKLLSDIRKVFSFVKIVKPDASRRDSSECYCFADGFKGNCK